MPMVTISISPEQVQHLRLAVESGAYASDSEAVRDALVLWCEARRRQNMPPAPPGRVELGRMAANRHCGKENADIAHLNVGDLLHAHTQTRGMS